MKNVVDLPSAKINHLSRFLVHQHYIYVSFCILHYHSISSFCSFTLKVLCLLKTNFYQRKLFKLLKTRLHGCFHLRT